MEGIAWSKIHISIDAGRIGGGPSSRLKKLQADTLSGDHDDCHRRAYAAGPRLASCEGNVILLWDVPAKNTPTKGASVEHSPTLSVGTRVVWAQCPA